jgi:hypothetical protein
MTESLYTNLRKYLKTENRDPLEPYLTNAFADLLNRLSQSDVSIVNRFVVEVLLAPGTRTSGPAADASLAKLRARLDCARYIEWTPEKHQGNAGRPDLELTIKAGGPPVLFVEVKLGAKLEEDQLGRYGRNLKEQYRGDASPAAAVVLLTHSTPPPYGFSDEDPTKSYGVPLRAVCYWPTVYDWVSHATVAGAGDGDAFLRVLIEEFKTFLAEHKMDTLNAADIQALDALFHAGTEPKITSFLSQSVRALEPWLREKYRLDDPKADPFEYTEGRGIWKWCRDASNRPKDWFIAWGLCAPASFFEEQSLSDELAAFVHLGCDDAESPPVPRGLLTGVEKRKEWREFTDTDYRYLKIRGAAGMAQTNAGFTAEFLQWLSTTFSEADEIFRRARSRIGKS